MGCSGNGDFVGESGRDAGGVGAMVWRSENRREQTVAQAENINKTIKETTIKQKKERTVDVSLGHVENHGRVLPTGKQIEVAAQNPAPFFFVPKIFGFVSRFDKFISCK